MKCVCFGLYIPIWSRAFLFFKFPSACAGNRTFLHLKTDRKNVITFKTFVLRDDSKQKPLRSRSKNHILRCEPVRPVRRVFKDGGAGRRHLLDFHRMKIKYRGLTHGLLTYACHWLARVEAEWGDKTSWKECTCRSASGKRVRAPTNFGGLVPRKGLP